MYPAVTVALLVVATLATAQPVDERTLESITGLLPQAQGPYPPAPPQAPYPAASGQSYSQYWEQQPAHTPQGFAVQSGYEGIIAPTGPSHDGPSALHKIGGVALGAGLLTHLLPFPFNKIVLFMGSKLGLFVMGFVLLVLIGGAATTAVCALTPICTISFLGLRLNKENVRSMLSRDRIDTITQFVYDAFDKYQKLQAREGKAFVTKPENKGKKPKYAKEEVKAAKDKKDTAAEDVKEEKEVKEQNSADVRRESKVLSDKESNEVLK